MSDRIDLLIKIMETHQEGTEYRLDKIDENLAEHMRRTALLETWAQNANNQLVRIDESLNKSSVNWKKVAGVISVIAGSIGALVQAFGG